MNGYRSLFENYNDYAKELFLFFPLRIAESYSRIGDYETALDWYRKIYDYCKLNGYERYKYYGFILEKEYLILNDFHFNQNASLLSANGSPAGSTNDLTFISNDSTEKYPHYALYKRSHTAGQQDQSIEFEVANLDFDFNNNTIKFLIKHDYEQSIPVQIYARHRPDQGTAITFKHYTGTISPNSGWQEIALQMDLNQIQPP